MVKRKRHVTNNLDKLKWICICEQNLHTKGQHAGKPNFYMLKQKYPEMDRKVLTSWWDKRKELKNSTHKAKRFKLDSPTANGHYPEMENALEKWVNNLRDRGACVSSFMIKVEAMRILRAEAEKNKTECIFKASNGWFYNFIFRKKFTLRRITTSGTIIKNFRSLLFIIKR